MLNKVTPPPLQHSPVANYAAEVNYGIIDWFKKCLRNYANFSGRARRKEYWCFFLVQFILNIIAMVLDSIVFNSETGLLYIIVALGLFLPSLSVLVRRLHDTNRSGWWVLFAPVIPSIPTYLFLFVNDKSNSIWWILTTLSPFVGIVLLLIWLISDTKPENNRWGAPARQ